MDDPAAGVAHLRRQVFADGVGWSNGFGLTAANDAHRISLSTTEIFVGEDGAKAGMFFFYPSKAVLSILAETLRKALCNRTQKIPVTTDRTKTCYHRNLYTVPNLAVSNAEALFFLALVRLALMQGSFKPSHGLA